MKLIDRYICRRFFATFVVMLLITVLLIILIHLTENAGTFRRYQLNYKVIMHYYCTLVPFMVNLLMPIVVFGTTVWVTTRLTKRSEIVALLSSGISFHRLALPYLSIGLVLTGIYFYLTGWLLATSNKERIQFEKQYGMSMFMPDTPDYVHIKAAPHQFLYVHTYNPYYNVGYDVRLDTFQNGMLIEQLYARQIKWKEADQQWLFRDWKKRVLTPKNEELTEGYSLVLPLAVDPTDFFINPHLREGLTLPELELHIQKLLTKGHDSVRFFIAEKHIRYMAPFAIVILIILGFLVSVHRSRAGIGRQITLGFLLAFLYIILFLFAKTVAETQNENPIWKIWIPNTIFTILCICFYRRTAQ